MSEVSIAAWTSKQKIVTKYSILSKRLWDNMIAVPWLIAQGYTNLVPTLIYHDNQGMLVSNQRNAQQRAKHLMICYFIIVIRSLLKIWLFSTYIPSGMMTDFITEPAVQYAVPPVQVTV